MLNNNKILQLRFTVKKECKKEKHKKKVLLNKKNFLMINKNHIVVIAWGKDMENTKNFKIWTKKNNKIKNSSFKNKLKIKLITKERWE